MEISIIIPCYNLERYIERSLKSILSQKYDNEQFEIILVLDSCTDKSREIAVNCLSKSTINSIVVITDVHNAGLARNIGLENATGEYIFFVDGDDYLTDTRALLKLKTNISENKSNAVYMVHFESEDESVFEIEKNAIWRYFFRRDIIGDTKFLFAPINEDWLFVGDIQRKREYTQSYIDDILYHYTHPREGSITAKFEHLIKGDRQKIKI